MTSPVILYDTTLRDGAQREGLSLTVDDKLKIASWLDQVGVHYIEGGWPGSNPKDIEFFRRVPELGLKTSKIACFGSTRRPGGKADSDSVVRELVASDALVACIVGKASDVQVTEAIGTTLDENLHMIEDTISFLRGEGLEVFFDAEHFFDGYRRNPEYSKKVLEVAANAGAATLVLCDTNGGAMPHDVAAVLDAIGSLPPATIGVHFHNDTGCAVANTVISVEHGAVHVQGTVNGIGERCGNANILTIAANLTLKMGVPVLNDEQLATLTPAHFAVAEICNVTPDPHQPYVGASAFATKAGLHTSGLAKMEGAYEHIDPGKVGNARRLLVSELSGRSTIVMKGKEIGLDLESNSDAAAAILANVKQLEHIGYHFEAADASLELLMRRHAGMEREFFRLESFRVTIEKREDGAVVSEATVKIWARGERYISTAEGNGPVNALDRALRTALVRFYPALESIELADYKVRILEENAGTDSVTRVLIESQDGTREWSTIGVSPNIIEASWQALVDALNFGLIHSEHDEG
ncbi:MAG TPA: citramalate synthase [Actinomycetota bacterium]|nr:citramalate synthase [Actinomycetota bacterium]